MKPILILNLAIAFASATALHAASISLDELDLTTMTSGWGKAQKNLSITQKPLSIGGVTFERGVGTHAASDFAIQLDGKAEVFSAKVGVDDDAGKDSASVEFSVYGDGMELWHSGACKWKQPPRDCRVELAGIKSLELVVEPAGESVSFDHADWAGAVIEFAGQPPRAEPVVPVKEEPVILTPPQPRQPHLNGPRVYGIRPGSPFLYPHPLHRGAPDGFQRREFAGRIGAGFAKRHHHRENFRRRDKRCDADRPQFPGRGARRIPHCGRRQAGAHAPHGLEQLVHSL